MMRRSFRGILLVAACQMILGAAADSGPKRVPPKPLPGNPVSVLPERAATEESEGDVEASFPDTQGRIYSISSDEAWAAALDVFKKLRIKFETLDKRNQIAITRWNLAARFVGLGNLVLEGRRTNDAGIQVHVFVSPFREPARVYVNTMVDARDRIFFNAGIVEKWFFHELELRLGQQGRALPKNPKRRRILAAQLLGQELDSRCPDNPKKAIRQGLAIVRPTLIASSRLEPLYPGDERHRGREATVFVRATIYEDGWVGDVQLMGGGGPKDQFEESAAETVKFWRYRPARIGDCLYAVPISLRVKYMM